METSKDLMETSGNLISSLDDILHQMPDKNAMPSLNLGLTCLLHRLEPLLKVKVCHLMYAANSHGS